MIEEAQAVIYRKLGLPPPPNDFTMTFELIDLPGPCIPMVTPTGSSAPSLLGNSTKINIASYAVATDFHGLTTPFKVLVHEMVHSYCQYYGGINYSAKPLDLKEGIALWTADQTPAQDFYKVPFHLRNARWERYLGYITSFQNRLRYHPVHDITNYLLS